jgi:DNA-binding response OmpR family regulator
MKDEATAAPRILVAEDETFLAMEVEAFLQDKGYSVVGPFARLNNALQAAEQEALDAALLDINLAGEMVFPVAEALERRGVPFLLVSGYDDSIMRKASPDWPRLMKPYRLEEVAARLAVMTGGPTRARCPGFHRPR